MSNTYEEYARSEKSTNEKEKFITVIDGVKHIDVIHNLVFRKVLSSIELLLILKYDKPNSSPKRYADIRGKVSIDDVGSSLTVNDEALYRCVHRELFEETNIFAKIIYEIPQNLNRASGTMTLFYDNISKRMFRTHTYASIFVSGEVENKEFEKHKDVNFFPISHLPSSTYYNTRSDINFFLPHVNDYFRTH